MNFAVGSAPAKQTELAELFGEQQEEIGEPEQKMTDPFRKRGSLTDFWRMIFLRIT